MSKKWYIDLNVCIIHLNINFNHSYQFAYFNVHFQRAGKYDPPPGASTVLGLELAGRVDKVSKGCTKWSVGDRVMALVSGKAKYKYALGDKGQGSQGDYKT